MDSQRSGTTICIGTLGLTTALGHCSGDSLAAARAGLTRATALPIHNFAGDEMWGGAPVIGHSVATVSVGHVGVSKIVALARHALKDLFSKRPLNRADWENTGLYLNLSDHFLLDSYASNREDWDNYGLEESPSAVWRRDCESVIPRVVAKLGGTPRKENQRLYFGGHTGIAQAIADAIRALSSGALERCIVGGVDSCIELHALEAAAQLGMLKTNAFPAGYLPGEAAAFFVLERGKLDAATRRVSICAGPVIVRDGINRLSDSPPNGRVLADVIDRMLTESHRRPSLLIGDLNGDAHRANDWGCAVVRLQQKFGIGDLPMWLAALSFGETGAAAGAIAVAMAVRGLERGYAPEGSILIWLASENGDKAVFMLE